MKMAWWVRWSPTRLLVLALAYTVAVPLVLIELLLEKALHLWSLLLYAVAPAFDLAKGTPPAWAVVVWAVLPEAQQKRFVAWYLEHGLGGDLPS